MDRNTSTAFNERSAPTVVDSDVGCPAPLLPVEDYLGELEKFGFTQEQSREYLSTLIPLIWHFVDLGFRGDISELLLPTDDSEALDSDGEFNTKNQIEDRKECAAE